MAPWGWLHQMIQPTPIGNFANSLTKQQVLILQPKLFKRLNGSLTITGVYERLVELDNHGEKLESQDKSREGCECS